MTLSDNGPGPFFYRPDPEREYWVQAKATKLERRGRCHYLIVGERPDGQQVGTRISATAVFTMRGI